MANVDRASEWRMRLLHTVAALLIVETLTGLAALLLPFSVSNQMMVLLHSVLGVVFVAPYIWYQLRHWRMYRSLRISHEVLTGYFSMAASVVLTITGLVLTWQALFANGISHAFDLVHIIATFALLASVLPHVLTPIVRARRVRATEAGAETLAGARTFGNWTMVTTVAPFVLLIAAVAFYRPPAMHNELPSDYSYVFGKNRPFAPSLATTASGGAYDSRLMSGSESCGRSSCHKDIYDQWSVSAHRYAAMDAAFQKVQTVMGKQNGPESTRYCGGCHDPISLFSGSKNVFAADLTAQSGYKEGVSCVACHAIKETDLKGNAAYTISPPDRYLFELVDRPAARVVSDFLIRAYPRYHVKSLEHKLFKSPEFCAACHKQFIDKEINKVGWVQLQNQFDNWRKSRWNHPGDAKKTIECRECHMPLVPSHDASAGDDLDYNRTPDDGKVRSHRFIAANQFIPNAMHLPNGGEQVRLTEAWLQGKIDVPEIAPKWRTGPAVPIEIVAADSVRAGQQIDLQAVLTNNKVGHEFPTGPLDIIQSWVELRVTDQDGKVVFQSGQLDSANFIAPGSFIFKSEPVDQYGNIIDRHNLWEMVGVRYRRSVFPGMSDRAEYTVKAPNGHTKALHVRARLLYRKMDQFLINFLFGESAHMTAPVTIVSEDEKTIRVVGSE